MTFVVWSFTGGLDGNSPRGDVLVTPAAYYETTSDGGANGVGAVVATVRAAKGGKGTTQAVWSFSGGLDGSFPSAGLIADASGNLYGTAALDGAGHAGTVFELVRPAIGQTAWTQHTLWAFTGGSDGGQPVGSLIADNSGSGVLYGTTSFGGVYSAGVVFSLTPSGSGAWTETILWNFTGQADGARPVAALVQDAGGTLYGTAGSGGASGVGTVFSLRPSGIVAGPWRFSAIWSPTGGADGSTPTGSLILDAAGNLYGTTQFGGQVGCGQAKYSYYGAPDSQTAYALGAPYVPPGGDDCGVVFRLARPVAGDFWTQSVVYSFTGGLDGANPVAGLLLDKTGKLRGTTPEYGGQPYGSPSNVGFWGNAFVLTPPVQPGGAWSELTTASFDDKSAGIYPRGGLSLAPDGSFYGTNAFGGAAWRHVSIYGYGVVFNTK